MGAPLNADHLVSSGPSQSSLARAKDLISRTIAQRHDRPSLVSEIACDVGAEIIEGHHLPGDDLNSVELSKRFSTSRTPIREALLLLEKEGLVEVNARKRPRVAMLPISEIREIYRVRAALFEIVATDVARTVTAEGLSALAAAVDEMKKACHREDLDVFVWANLDFYERNTQFANNRTVKRILDSLVIRTARLRRLSLQQPARMAQSLDDHARILRAYEERDAALAAALIRSNHINALAALETNLLSAAGA